MVRNILYNKHVNGFHGDVKYIFELSRVAYYVQGVVVGCLTFLFFYGATAALRQTEAVL